MPKSTTNKTIEQERGAGPRRPRPFFKAAHIEPLNRGRTVGRSTSGRAFVCPRRRRRFCSRPLSFCGKLRKRHTGPHRRFYKVGPFRMLDSLRRSEPQKPPIFRHDFFVVACLLAGKSQRGALEKFKAGFSRNNCAAQIMPGNFPSKNTAIFLALLQPGNLDNQHRRGTSKTEPEATAQGQRRPGLACLVFDTESRGGRTAETAGGSAPKTQSRLFAQGREEPGTAGGVSGAKTREFREQNAGDFPHPIQALKQEGSKRGSRASCQQVKARGKQEDRQPWHVKKTSRGRAVPGQIPVK